MRVLLLALMIALLPLRGWVSDVMAMDLASQSMAAAPSQVHAGMDDCPEMHAGHGQAAVPPAPEQADTHASGDCSHCSVCQICHSVALTPMLPLLPLPVLATVMPVSSQPLYASAERAPGDKPPIL